MKISIQWLKDYVAAGLSSEKLAHKLTMAGLEVEKIENIGGDTVFEMEITPNRPDCLNMIGIAREVSAILGKDLKLPKVRKIKFPRAKCDVSILDREGCSRYIGTLIKDVKIFGAPERIQKRIRAIGIRPVNNVVDITNFCLMETGQPLHAFDYDKLEGGRIIVRRARKGEKIVTIDGVERELDPSIIVIADADHPVAIAGIMGGLGTEVSKDTKNILLESAYFNPIFIRRAARKLGLSSDSSYRFERGVDICMVEGGAARAISIICKEAGGQVIQRNDVFPVKQKIRKKEIRITSEMVNGLLGTSLTLARCKIILKKLGFQVKAFGKGKEGLLVTPPSFRGDINHDVDIVEEIARIIGYDNLPSSLPLIKHSSLPEDVSRVAKKRTRAALIAQGLNEAITYSLINPKDLERSKLSQYRGVYVKNPLTQDQEVMRPSCLPSLLAVLTFNLNRGQKNIKMFELGKNYLISGEKEVVAILMTGLRHQDWREIQKSAIDFYDIKGVVNSLCLNMGVKNLKLNAHDYDIFASGEGASIKVASKEIGFAGRVSEDILEERDIKQKNVFFAQISMADLHADSASFIKYQPFSEYPAITRDVSIAVKKDILFSEIKCIVEKISKQFLTRVDLVEQYLGEKIPAGQKGIVFSIKYQSLTRTLTEEEISNVQQQICQSLDDQLGATIR